MRPFDIAISLLIPTVILIHLLVAPYTKVEESFNIQAAHDFITYASRPGGLSGNLRLFDHVDFPGSVPRTFVGAFALALISNPIIFLVGPEYAQFVVRFVLGMFNAYALFRFKQRLAKAYGDDVGRWYTFFQISQFHVMFYASRTLPNMFAFGLSTMALGEFLPYPNPTAEEVQKRQKFGIFLFVIAAAVFRSEVAILMILQLLYLLIVPRMSLQQMVPAGLECAVVAFGISIPIDSYFWQKPLWPELWGFYYNAIQGKAADWGTSPYSYYFTVLLARLLLNPLITAILIPLSLMFPALKRHSTDLIVPSILFIAIYSLQPHKEARFIIYVVPALTAAASLSASYIWKNRTKGFLYELVSGIVIFSLILCFAGSIVMLLISSLNYPGGEAITSVRHIISQTQWPENHPKWERLFVHMDVLSCMTGATRFQEIPTKLAGLPELPVINGVPTHIVFDKTEHEEKLLEPAFWEQFDYALMEAPGKAIGTWEVIDTVYAYAGMEFLRPGQEDNFEERVYAANNLTKNGGVMSSEDVQEAAEDPVDLESDSKKRGLRWGDLKTAWHEKTLTRYGIYVLVKDTVRSVTGGYWIGPRMAPAIRILKRVKDGSP